MTPVLRYDINKITVSRSAICSHSLSFDAQRPVSGLKEPNIRRVCSDFHSAVHLHLSGSCQPGVFFVCCPAPRQPPSFSCSGSQSAMRHGGVQSPVKQPFRRYGVNTVQEAARLPPCAPRQKTRRRQRRQYPRQGLAVGRVERTHASYSQPSSAVVSAVVNGLTPLTEYDLHTASY